MTRVPKTTGFAKTTHKPPASPKGPGFDPSWQVPPFLWAALFFLCGADHSFATRILGYNFRWAQILILIFALAAFLDLRRKTKESSGSKDFHLQILKCWAPFFLIYLLAALFSETRQPTILKWGWGVFNIGAAALLCLNSRRNQFIAKGFSWGIAALSLFIWSQAIALYWFGAPGIIERLGTSNPFSIDFFGHSIPWGYVQPAWRFEELYIFRPAAFYYEPSYAGCSLAFAFPLTLALASPSRRLSTALLPALVLSAVILTGSRSGIFSVFFSLLIAGLLGLRGNLKKRVFFLGKVAGLSLLGLCLFNASHQSRQYFGFLLGPLGIQSLSRTSDSSFSEGRRISMASSNLEISKLHPILGNGILPRIGEQGLAQVSMNTWVELMLESGWLGLSSFIFAVLATIRAALRRSARLEWIDFIIAAWLSHFLIHLNLTQTFPRLDYWILFFLSIRFLMKSDDRPNQDAARGPLQAKSKRT